MVSPNSQSKSIVEIDGRSYFLVDQDLSKGDRRGDGTFTAEFFMEVDGGRRKEKRLLYEPSHQSIMHKNVSGLKKVKLSTALSVDASKTGKKAGLVLGNEMVSSKKPERKGACVRVRKTPCEENVTGRLIVGVQEQVTHGLNVGICAPPTPDS